MTKQLSVKMKCSSCGHEQVANGFETENGSRYFGSSANWCDACERGKPEPIESLDPPAPTVDQIIDLLVRTADDYAEDCVRAGFVTTRSKNRDILAERLKTILTTRI